MALCLLWVPALAEAQGPALWKIGGTNLYIFGSIDILKPETAWLDDDLRAKISSASAIYLEISDTEMQPDVLVRLIRKYGLLAKGDSLKNHLPRIIYAQMSAAFRQHGLDENGYDLFKPWLAALVYHAYRDVAAGYSSGSGVEATITGLAQSKHIPIKGLETAEFQVALLASLTDQDAADVVTEDLAEADEALAARDRLVTSWSNGDLADLAAYFDERGKDDPEGTKKIFTERNTSWVAKIRAIMGMPGTYLVVVGTGHLLGPQSLIALLQQAGVTVERVN